MRNYHLVLRPKPVDRHGKLNSFRHSLTGQVHIFTPEDQEAVDKHCTGIHESLAPAGAFNVMFGLFSGLEAAQLQSFLQQT
jgi:hypothetical protein